MKLVDLLDAWNREGKVHVCRSDRGKCFVAEKEFTKTHLASLDVESFEEDCEGGLFVYIDSLDKNKEDFGEEFQRKIERLSNLKLGDKFRCFGNGFVKVKLSPAFDGFEGCNCNIAVCLDTNTVWCIECDCNVEVLE